MWNQSPQRREVTVARSFIWFCWPFCFGVSSSFGLLVSFITSEVRSFAHFVHIKVNAYKELCTLRLIGTDDAHKACYAIKSIGHDVYVYGFCEETS